MYLKFISDDGSKYAGACQRLIFMVAKSKLPYSFVESEGFLIYSTYLNSKFKPPKRKQFTELVSRKYIALSDIEAKDKKCAILCFNNRYLDGYSQYSELFGFDYPLYR